MLDLLNMALHIDQTFGVWLTQYGSWVYLVLFLIIFGETGFVVLPFLPGDSLLFIAGAFAASERLDLLWLLLSLIVAAVSGNLLNYTIGRYIGPRVFSMNIRFLNRTALLRAHTFYEKHGGKTIIVSRFLPLLRTFVPFVAGVAQMRLVHFQVFNIMSALLWVGTLVTAGYFFGNIPGIKDHLNLIVLIGVAAAIVPLFFMGLYKVLQRKSMRPKTDTLSRKSTSADYDF